MRLVNELGPNDPGSIVLGAAFDPLLATVPPTPLLGYEAWKPALPAGIAFLDALTIDGPVRNTFDRNGSSGFDAFDDARMKFDARFYLVAILFIIFDLEVAFLFPWAVAFLEVGWFGFWSMMIFLGVLTVGFIYEWRKGALEWD